mgnify:CR=1 FL=1
MKNRRLISLPLAIVVLTFLMLTTVTLIGEGAEPQQTTVGYFEEDTEEQEDFAGLQIVSFVFSVVGFLLVMVRRQP